MPWNLNIFVQGAQKLDGDGEVHVNQHPPGQGAVKAGWPGGSRTHVHVFSPRKPSLARAQGRHTQGIIQRLILTSTWRTFYFRSDTKKSVTQSAQRPSRFYARVTPRSWPPTSAMCGGWTSSRPRTMITFGSCSEVQMFVHWGWKCVNVCVHCRLVWEERLFGWCRVWLDRADHEHTGELNLHPPSKDDISVKNAALGNWMPAFSRC